MVAQDFRCGAGLAHDLLRNDSARGIPDDVLGHEREQLRFADHTSGKGSARHFDWALPDRSTSDVSRRRDFDFVHAAGTWVVLGGASICADHSRYCSATFERGKNSSPGVGRLFRILSTHALSADPARLVSMKWGGHSFVSVYAVHGDAAQQLGIKVGGLLRHHFSGGGDAHDLIDVHWIQQKRDLGGTAIDGLKSGRGFALVAEISFGGNGLQGNSKRGL